MTSFLLRAAEEAAAHGAAARPHSESQLVLPNLNQVKFLGMSGATLLMLLMEFPRKRWDTGRDPSRRVLGRTYGLETPDMVGDDGTYNAWAPMFAGLPFGPRRLHLLPELAGTAIAIAILGMLEATSITKGLASKSGQKIEPNQELIGMGFANIAGSFFGAVPGSSSFARSAVNFQSGARTQMSSMFSSIVVLLVPGGPSSRRSRP